MSTKEFKVEDEVTTPYGAGRVTEVDEELASYPYRVRINDKTVGYRQCSADELTLISSEAEPVDKDVESSTEKHDRRLDKMGLPQRTALTVEDATPEQRMLMGACANMPDMHPVTASVESVAESLDDLIKLWDGHGHLDDEALLSSLARIRDQAYHGVFMVQRYVETDDA